MTTHPEGQGAQIPTDRRGRASQEPISGPGPNGETKPSFQSRTNKPRPRRGDPIAKVGNPRREEKALEPVYPEPDGGRRAGRKPKKVQAQQQVCAQPLGKQGSTTQGTWRSSRRSQEKMGTGKYSDKLGKSAVTSHKEP